MANGRQLIQEPGKGSHPQPPALVERIRRHPDNEGDADVPDGERARDHGDEPLALVLAEIAGAERELSACQEQDHAKDRSAGTVAAACPTEPLKKIAVSNKTAPRMTTRTTSACAELDVTSHAASAMAHGHAADTGAE